MRVAAISLPELRVEVVRELARAKADTDAEALGVREGIPLAIVVAEAPLTEAKLLGNTRLDVVSREARVLGVHPGHTIAQARARAPNLAVRVVRPEAVHGVLARLAEVALAFGATVSFASAHDARSDAHASSAFGDVVWVDVTGCAHLHVPRDRDRDPASAPAREAREAREAGGVNEGEAILAGRLARVFGGLGHTCAVAIADGPRVAAILACAAAASRASRGDAGARAGSAGARARQRLLDEDDEAPLVIVPSGKNALALAPLAVTALPIGADDARWLVKLGVHTVAELRALPRSALATRLGARAAVVLGLADGEDRAPLTPYVPPDVPEESATLEYGVEGSEALTFVAKTLTDRLATRLAGRAVAASRIELDLTIDVALLRSAMEDGAPEPERVQRIAIDLPAPLSTASDLLAALRPKIERAVLEAPVLSAKLRAASLVRKPQAALSLFEPQPKAERALPRLVAELAADLGETAVGKLSLGDAWVPEDRSRFVRLNVDAQARTQTKAASSARSGKAGTSGKPGRAFARMLASVPEPTRILAEPVLVPRDSVKVIRHLSRLEAVEWWKLVPESAARSGAASRKGVDYVHAWVDEGSAWVEIDRATGQTRVCGWFD